jgi:outer membrane protein assembly factor BamB
VSTSRQDACGETVYGITSANGLLYLGSSGGVIAFDPATRTPRWQFDTNNPVMLAPSIVDSRIYFGSHDQYLYAADLSGNEIWRYNMWNMVFGSPTVAGSTVYGGSAAEFAALDAGTGERKWIIDLGTWVETSWSREVVGGVIYLGTAHGELIAVDAATGVELWRFQVPSKSAETGETPTGSYENLWIHDPPVRVDGIVYFSSMNEHLYAVDAATGNLLWRFNLGAPAYPSPVVVDGTVYAASHGHLFALDAATGVLRWQQQIEGVFSPVTVDGGLIYVSHDRAHGRLAAFDAQTGRPRWEYQYSQSTYYEFSRPVVLDGVVYVGDWGTFCQGLFAVDASSGALLWRAMAPS